jgi:hypothetical protein
MTRPLRQIHRRVFMALGVFLPIAFAVGLAARKSVPAASELPEPITFINAKFSEPEWTRDELFAGEPIQVRLLREKMGSGQYALAFSASKNFLKPDLLVYWSAGGPGSGATNSSGALPENSILLGAFGPAPLPLPQDVGQSEGTLLLYSLADGEIVSASKPIAFGVPPNHQ